MKISELISALEYMLKEHGDLDVETTSFDGSRVRVNTPKLAHRAKLRGRESKPRFAEWYSHEKDYQANRKGDPVCRL